MPHWHPPPHSFGHGHSLAHPFGSSSSSSHPPSGQGSRAPSPTRQSSTSSTTSGPTDIAAPSRADTADSIDPLDTDLVVGTPQSGHSLTTAYGHSAHSEMWGGSQGAQTPGGGYSPVEIILDSEHLILRGQGGDMNPAYLSGRIELDLQESTNIKEINMALACKAKVQFTDLAGASSKSHHYSHPIYNHDWSFLQGDKRHTHTLKAGHHSFPFSLALEGTLPSSIHTYTGDAVITYILRANVLRSGFAKDFHAVKDFTLQRTFTPEALEFNQTLEIENTWPGKVMYAITLPFKAYAAGDNIPVRIKFMPLTKGVKVTTMTSVLKEYSQVNTRHSQHPDQRVASCVKHELGKSGAVLVAEEPVRPPLHWGYSHTSAGSTSARHSPTHTPMPPSTGRGSGEAGPSTGSGTAGNEEEIEGGEDEIDNDIVIPIPRWTTPSHTIHPVVVTHKIKWSCAILNPDGHVSELRCALPVIILDHSLLEEARTSSAITRGLLFGGSAEEAPVDLPSYSNHVYDRVAIADSGSSNGLMPRSSGHSSASHTPPSSRPPSRPGSPTNRHRDLENDVPPRRELSDYADQQLLLSLGALNVHSNPSSPGDTPAASRGPSRPLSRRTSRTNSRPSSRTSSPERQANSERRSSGLGFGSAFHIPFKHMKPLSKPILRNASGGHLSSSPTDSVQRNAASFSNLPDRRSSNPPARVQFGQTPHRAEPRFHLGSDTPEEIQVDPMNRVPSYAIAARGFLGGGVVPLHSGPPTYDEAERTMERSRSGELLRPRSDSALVQMGSAGAAGAEGRAAEGSGGGVGGGADGGLGNSGGAGGEDRQSPTVPAAIDSARRTVRT